MENSILIATFDGWKKDESFKDNVYRKGNRIELDSTFKYHKSWDWLMPIIIKILNIDLKETGNVLVDSNTFHFQTLIRQSLIIKPSIERTYKWAVEFIKWHNKN